MTPDPLSATFAALADPTRRAILARLSLGETSVSELAEPFDISLPAVSRHLKVLEHAGLIARGREAQWRPCRIEPQALSRAENRRRSSYSTPPVTVLRATFRMRRVEAAPKTSASSTSSGRKFAWPAKRAASTEALVTVSSARIMCVAPAKTRSERRKPASAPKS